jgi:hypothetical protein
MLNASLATGASGGIAKGPGCPTVAQMGEVDITIPAGELVGSAEFQFTRCAGMNIQVTGGSMLDTPIIINAIAHQDHLILKAYLQKPQPGPLDVTLWWRVD